MSKVSWTSGVRLCTCVPPRLFNNAVIRISYRVLTVLNNVEKTLMENTCKLLIVLKSCSHVKGYFLWSTLF